MRCAQIKDNVVTNLIVSDSGELSSFTLLPALGTTQVGDRLTADGNLPKEIWAWSKATQERRRFTETDPPTVGYTAQEPPPYCLGWDADADVWVSDHDQALNDAKIAKKTAIDVNTNRIRDRDGLLYAGARFAMTEGAKLNWTGLLAASDILPLPMTILTLDDNPFEIADQKALKGFLMAVMSYDTADGSPVTSGRQLRMRVEAAATIEELDAIVDDRE